jgi:hypothetical protein
MHDHINFRAQKVVLIGTNWGPNLFDPEFWSKIEFGTPFNPFVFFSCPVSGFVPCSTKLGVFVPSFNNFTNNSNIGTIFIIECHELVENKRKKV